MPSDGATKAKGASLMEGTCAGSSCGKGSRIVAQAVSQMVIGAEAIAGARAGVTLGLTGAWAVVDAGVAI